MRNEPGGIQFLQGHLPPPSGQDLLPEPGAWSLEPGLEGERPVLPAELMGEGC